MITLILDHLWQSTLFAGAAGLVTLLLTRNAARLRFWIWFAASVKFLVPFAALSALGAGLLPQAMSPVLAGFVPAAESFVAPVASARAVAAAVPAAQWSMDWTVLLFAAWSVGTLAIAFHWLSRWLRLRATLAKASDVMAASGVAVRSAPGLLEPGLFGIFNPVILLPQGIGEKLSPAELDAVLAHEACHGSHRDNLLAAVHMLVEALFWFHPLVWWLGARLNHERERACDEAVLASGQDCETYAQGILKVCRFYVQSPLDCVPGISGAGLKQRIERIVDGGVTRPLGRVRAVLLAGLAAGSLIVPVSAGFLMAPQMVQAQSQSQSQTQPVVTPERMAELRSEQAAVRKPVAFDAKNFDKFAGAYQLGPFAIMWVTREGDHYFTRLTGQVAVQIFPESQDKFFATVVQAQISFDRDAGGRVTGLVLHQNGLEQHAPRITDAAAHAAEDALLARIRNNKPSPGTEAAVRHQIESMEKGAPDYSVMTPTLAAITSSLWPSTSQFLAGLGPFKSLAFQKVAPGGVDLYAVTFERGQVEWRIQPLRVDKKIQGMSFRAVP